MRFDTAQANWTALSAEDAQPKQNVLISPLFYQTLQHLQAKQQVLGNQQLQILLLGCGSGDLSAYLCRDLGHHVVGVDSDPQAVERARWQCCKVASDVTAVFWQADVTRSDFVPRLQKKLQAYPDLLSADPLLDHAIGKFQLVILQLVLSMVPGPEERRATLRNAFEASQEGGMIYLSCFGSSKDGISYHSLSIVELQQLLEEAGFSEISVQQKKEASASFLYATARKPLPTVRTILK